MRWTACTATSGACAKRSTTSSPSLPEPVLTSRGDQRQRDDLAVAGVITASEPSWPALFTGLSLGGLGVGLGVARLYEARIEARGALVRFEPLILLRG